MTNQKEAMNLIDKLEGTVITDLRSLLDWSENYQSKNKQGSQFGGLNFTLCILSLVACEVFGFYITGASKHEQSDSDDQTDTGYYIMEFLKQFFPSDSYFKKLKKVLADFLRNDLVHVFGSANLSIPFEIELFINSDVGNQIISSSDGKKKTLKLNSIALAHHTIEAFNKLKKEVNRGTDTSLCDNILEASRYTHNVSRSVLNEFDDVYQEIEQKKLVLSKTRNP